MKQLTAILFCLTAICANGQNNRDYNCAVNTGVGFPLSTPQTTQFSWQIAGYRNFTGQFSAGAGFGFSVCETTLLPLFAAAKLLVVPRKLSPFIETRAGYAFATSKGNNGGVYISPSIGVQYKLSRKLKLELSAGYEYQYLERLKYTINEVFISEFAEKLNHNTLILKAGVIF
jgi:hypothetical protein